MLHPVLNKIKYFTPGKMHRKTYSFTSLILHPGKITWPQECLDISACRAVYQVSYMIIAYTGDMAESPANIAIPVGVAFQWNGWWNGHSSGTRTGMAQDWNATGIRWHIPPE